MYTANSNLTEENGMEQDGFMEEWQALNPYGNYFFSKSRKSLS